MRKKRFWIFLSVIVLLGMLGSLVWSQINRKALPSALSSLISDTQVQVETGPWLVFTPIGNNPSSGLIIYPGAFVDPEAYAPNAKVIAAAGYLVVIPRMPFNLAVSDPNSATNILEAFPEISSWAIGGHSLGGAMAARYTEQNPDMIQGLVLWASYPAESNDLSNQAVSVLSIYGSVDGVATPEEVLSSKVLLPEDTVWVPIEGGNHAQFGWYGLQTGDNLATISREEQSSQIVKATIDLLANLEK
jgi:dienelactone hydrolase